MRLALGLLAILVGTAHADEAKRAQLRTTAEAHERDAKASNDLAKYAACGQAYLDLYNDNPKAALNDEVLYNAGVCFEGARSVGAAINMYEMLGKHFPTSKLRPKAIARSAKAYEQIGLPAKAVVLLKEYATKYAGEMDAGHALSDATFIRRALGDDDKAIENTKFFIRTFTGKRPEQAPPAMYALGPLYAKKSANAYQQHLREFIRLYSKDQELLARVWVDLGESLWKSACAKPDADGLCLRVTRPRVLPIAARKVKPTAGQLRCGPASSMTVTPIARDAKLVAEAVVALESAEKVFARLGTARPHVIYARAKAKSLLADRQLEEYLALRFPVDLDFSPGTPKKEASLKRFSDFIGQKTKLGGLAQGKYSAIADYKDAWTTVAAMQRYGFLQHSFALDMMTAELPKDVRTGQFAVEKIEAFCDKMNEVAEPLMKSATESYDLCLSKGSQFGIHDATTRACARERATIDPTTFAISTEMLPELPIALPVVAEAPRPSANHPQDIRTALEKLRVVPLKGCEMNLRVFEGLAKQHKLADVEAAVGFLHGHCGKPEQARLAYQRALQIDPKHAISISNLGELEFRAGNRDAAAKQWEAALVIDGKIYGARVGLGAMALATLRGLPAKAPNRAQVEKDVEFQASNAAAIAAETSPAPYVLMALLAVERAQPRLARHYLDFARRIDASPHTELARAAIAANDGGDVLAVLDGAATGWPNDDTHLALALGSLAARRYDQAHAALGKVQRRTYDVLLARGIALRGQGNYADAEKRYAEAIALDATRPEAHFALGVLWKDYKAARAASPTVAKAAFQKAAESFRKAGTPDAKALADDCDKAIVALP